MDVSKVKSKQGRSVSRKTQQRTRTGSNRRNLSSKRRTETPVEMQVVKTTIEELKERKCLDQRRWLCISRPQLHKSCGVSSLVSCWNYLYSTLGAGQLAPVTQEQALQIVGINPPFDNIDFGSFTGNGTLKKWFRKLCAHFQVKGSAKTFYKAAYPGKTSLTADSALNLLMTGLRGHSQAFIYHCYNHYFCPIGFELTPTSASEAYSSTPTTWEAWIAIGETSVGHPCIHFKKWTDVVLDITSAFPQFYDIRRQEKGVQQRAEESYISGSKAGTNMHCLMTFEKED